MAGCRSSGVLTASKIVFKGSCKLISIHACEVGGPPGPLTIKVFDGLSNSGLEVARMVLNPGQTFESDMHGVLCKTGLYYEETTGAGAVSIEFA
jgi:hypothetical protein